MAPKLYRRCASCHCTAHRGKFWRLVRVPIAKDSHSVSSAEISDQVIDKALDQDTSPSNNQRFQVQLGQGMGRSAYLCKRLDCLQIAQKKNRLGRSLRVPIPAEVFEILKNSLNNVT